jgi:hydrogenase maturation protease
VTAPLLVIAVGNPARGDDGLGPALLERLAAEGLEDVELLLDFQLQVEHALDLVGREAVLFVDATKAAVGVQLSPVAPAEALPALSHALTPAGVLHVARRLGQEVPDAWQLAIEGEAFGLGEGLNPAAQARLTAALTAARGWVDAHRDARQGLDVPRSCQELATRRRTAVG